MKITQDQLTHVCAQVLRMDVNLHNHKYGYTFSNDSLVVHSPIMFVIFARHILEELGVEFKDENDMNL